jgi:hypothetical protein
MTFVNGLTFELNCRTNTQDFKKRTDSTSTESEYGKILNGFTTRSVYRDSGPRESIQILHFLKHFIVVPQRYGK